MASDEITDEGARPPCSACRGTGRVISSRGGTPHEVPCPWCEGRGQRLPGHDAQSAAREGHPPDGGDGPAAA